MASFAARAACQGACRSFSSAAASEARAASAAKPIVLQHRFEVVDARTSSFLGGKMGGARRTGGNSLRPKRLPAEVAEVVAQGKGFDSSSAASSTKKKAGAALANIAKIMRPVSLRPEGQRVRKGVVSPQLDVPEDIQRPPYAQPKGRVRRLMGMNRGIEIKSAEAIAKMRRSGRLAAEILQFAGSLVKPGVTTDDIDRAVHAMCVLNGAYPSPLNYDGFPKSVCTSVNEVVCHGIPDSRKLVDGDICNIDVTVYLDGYHGDTNATFFCGEADEASRRLVETTHKCLHSAIAACRPGVPLNKIGEVISDIAAEAGYGIVEEYCGHGIGSEFHCDPSVFHCKNEDRTKMKAGMTFTIEPMVNEGGKGTALWDDRWTVVTRDGGRSAQFEHTILITEDGADILTSLGDAPEFKIPESW
eukprot:tig00020554_g10876.t1